MFVPVLLNQRRFAIQDGVDGVVAEVQKERLVFVPSHKLHSLFVHAVDQELVFSHLVFRNIQPTNGLLSENIRPEVGSVSDSLYLTGKVPLKAVVLGFYFMRSRVVLVSCQVPFSDHAGCISISGKDFRKACVRCGKSIG